MSARDRIMAERKAQGLKQAPKPANKAKEPSANKQEEMADSKQPKGK